ncbi:MAG: type I secretion system permease/ATPase [Alphaproteobacteria bacterium]|nr:type I secretion system permease/ATPase [Alphaproteobacteria bacterium]
MDGSSSPNEHMPAGGAASPARSVDTGLLSLTLLLRYLGQPADPEQIAHRFGAPNRKTDAIGIVRAAQQLGVKVRLTSTSWDRLGRTTLPAIAEMRDERFVVLAKSAPDKVLILDPRQARNQVVDRTTFEAAWTGRLVLATTRAKLAGPDRGFDFSWFIPSVIKYRYLFAEVLTGSLFLQLFALISPLMFQVVIDKVIVHNSLSTLDVLVFALAAIAMFEALLGGLRTFVFAHTTTRVDVELGARLFNHLLALPMQYFLVRQAGTSVARCRELENIRNFLTSNAITVVLDLLFTFVFLAVMFVFSATLTWIVIASLPLYAAVSVFVTPILRRRLDEKFRRGSENQAFLVETVTGVETIKSMAVEPQMQRRWEEQLAGYVRAAFSATNLNSQAGQVITFINKLATAATLWFGAKLVIDGSLTIGELVAFNMLAGRVSQPVLRLSQLWQDFQQVRISVARLGDILNTPREGGPAAGRVGVPPLKGDICFDQVVFRYRSDGPEIMKGVSLDIPAGQIVGVVGPSGSGKSTLAKLVQRLFVPESGRVRIDGLDVALLDPSGLRRQIGVVMQENVLFSGTIRDNIALSNPAMEIGAVMTAAKLAGAHEFIVALDEGYDTVVGERGSSLSGGQRQRIAIARALATNPRILVFDEATSALDAESERIIQDNMRLICKGRTVIIIAHRLSAVRLADRIITIEAGRVVEDGTHDTLLQRGGRYAALYRHQIGPAAHVG